MKLSSYLRDKFPEICLFLSGAILLSLYLYGTGNSESSIALVLISGTAAFVVFLLIRFLLRKRYLQRLLDQTMALDERYLLPEVMKKPYGAEDQVYHRILKLAGKSMLEEVAKSRSERVQYQEYIEQWIHSIKTPIAGAKLLCENADAPQSREIMAQLERINHVAEQTLYYARSGSIDRDFFIRPMALEDAIHTAIATNKQWLRENDMKLSVEACNHTVYADEKWVVFILCQLLVNAVQYKRTGCIRFYARAEPERVTLSIEDDGIGISQADLPRVFDKGFSGGNGRVNRQATGMGLYICKQLCMQMGIDIQLTSKIGEFTIVSLGFRNAQ